MMCGILEASFWKDITAHVDGRDEQFLSVVL